MRAVRAKAMAMAIMRQPTMTCDAPPDVASVMELMKPLRQTETASIIVPVHHSRFTVIVGPKWGLPSPALLYIHRELSI